MTLYRWATPVRKGRWTPSREAAVAAAIRARVASRDEHSGQVYWDVFAEIERREA